MFWHSMVRADITWLMKGSLEEMSHLPIGVFHCSDFLISMKHQFVLSHQFWCHSMVLWIDTLWFFPCSNTLYLKSVNNCDLATEIRQRRILMKFCFFFTERHNYDFYMGRFSVRSTGGYEKLPCGWGSILVHLELTHRLCICFKQMFLFTIMRYCPLDHSLSAHNTPVCLHFPMLSTTHFQLLFWGIDRWPNLLWTPLAWNILLLTMPF